MSHVTQPPHVGMHRLVRRRGDSHHDSIAVSLQVMLHNTSSLAFVLILRYFHKSCFVALFLLYRSRWRVSCAVFEANNGELARCCPTHVAKRRQRCVQQSFSALSFGALSSPSVSPPQNTTRSRDAGRVTTSCAFLGPRFPPPAPPPQPPFLCDKSSSTTAARAPVPSGAALDESPAQAEQPVVRFVPAAPSLRAASRGRVLRDLNANAARNVQQNAGAEAGALRFPATTHICTKLGASTTVLDAVHYETNATGSS